MVFHCTPAIPSPAFQGKERLERVTVAEVDARMRPIPGTEQELECDSLILSVGLIPENELAEALGRAFGCTNKRASV